MPDKQSPHITLTPELYRKAQCCHSLLLSSDEASSKVHCSEIVHSRVQICNLADVVGYCIEQAACHVFCAEELLFLWPIMASILYAVAMLMAVIIAVEAIFSLSLSITL